MRTGRSMKSPRSAKLPTSSARWANCLRLSPSYRPRNRMFSRPVSSGFMPSCTLSSALRLPWTRIRPATGS